MLVKNQVSDFEPYLGKKVTLLKTDGSSITGTLIGIKEDKEWTCSYLTIEPLDEAQVNIAYGHCRSIDYFEGKENSADREVE